MKKNIEYFQLVKEAINLTKNNRVLWWFGFLAVFCGSGFSFNYNLPSDSFDSKEFDEMAFANAMRKVSFYWENYWQWIILVAVLVLMFTLALCILGIIGRGALISSILKVNNNETVSFKEGFKRGLFFLKKIFLLYLLSFLIFLVLAFVLFFPVVRLMFLKAYLIGILLGVLAVFLMISISILFLYLKKYAEIYIVSSNLGVFESLKLAYHLFERNIKESILMGLVILLINFIIGIAIFASVFIVLILGGIIGYVIFYQLWGSVGLVILTVIFLILLTPLVFLMNAILNVFFQALWILFFNKIAAGEEKDNKPLGQEQELSNVVKENGVEPNVI